MSSLRGGSIERTLTDNPQKKGEEDHGRQGTWKTVLKSYEKGCRIIKYEEICMPDLLRDCERIQDKPALIFQGTSVTLGS
jgi:hypothetical protein